MFAPKRARSGVLLICIAAPAMANDLAVGARIDDVKVYAEGAAVTRRAQIAIPAGSHRLIFRDLPATLDADTLRISVASREVRLGGVEVEAITLKDYVSPQERELRARLEKLGDERAVIQDEIATAETQLKLLDSLAATPVGGGVSKPAVDAANLASVLNTMSSGASTARTRIRDAKIRQRALEREAEKLNADLQKIATARKQTFEVRASIDAAAAVDAAVAIEYTTDDAGWRWVYEGRLDTQARRVTLARQASVEQSSGEDWSNATLTLTTANPSEDVTTPQVASLFLDLEEADVYAKRAVSAPAVSADVMQEVVVTGMRRPAEVSSTDYLVEYKIPGRVSVDSDGEPRLYPVAEEQLSVNLLARVIPSASRSAYLEALFKYDADVPMQGGELHLYRDGAFVGLAGIDALLPGADVRLPFGADERIQVQVRDEAKQSGEKGVVSKTRIEEHRQRFEATNYHSSPVTIEIVDRVPVSENKDVRVELLKGATAATEKDLDGKAGVLLWRTETKPRETATVRHYYSVRYPADQQLSRRDADE